MILVSLGLTTFLAFPPKNKAPPAAEHHHSLAAEHDWGGSCEAKLVENQKMLNASLPTGCQNSGKCYTSRTSVAPDDLSVSQKKCLLASRTMVIELSWKLLTNVAANGGTHLYEQCAPWEWTYNSSVKWVVSAQNSWMKQPPSEWCNLREWKSSYQPKQVRPWRLATFPAEVVSTDRSTRCSLIKRIHPATWRKPLGRSEWSTNHGKS